MAAKWIVWLTLAVIWLLVEAFLLLASRSDDPQSVGMCALLFYGCGIVGAAALAIFALIAWLV